MPFFSNLTPLNLGENSVKSLRVTQIEKQNNAGGGEGERESKKVVQRQAVTTYLRLTLTFMWKRTPREKFNRDFLTLCC